MLLAAERVQDLELRRGHHQPAVLVLAEEGHQPRGDRAQLLRRHGAALQVRARRAVGHHAAAEHQLRHVERDALGQLGQLRVGRQGGGRLEDALDVCLLGAGTHDAAPRLAAEQQVERLGEHRLARAGLAGDRVQARSRASSALSISSRFRTRSSTSTRYV